MKTRWRLSKLLKSGDDGWKMWVIDHSWNNEQKTQFPVLLLTQIITYDQINRSSSLYLMLLEIIFHEHMKIDKWKHMPDGY